MPKSYQHWHPICKVHVATCRCLWCTVYTLSLHWHTFGFMCPESYKAVIHCATRSLPLSLSHSHTHTLCLLSCRYAGATPFPISVSDIVFVPCIYMLLQIYMVCINPVRILTVSQTWLCINSVSTICTINPVRVETYTNMCIIIRHTFACKVLVGLMV